MTDTNLPRQTLRLPYVAPWDWQQFHTHFALRTLRGVECLEPRRYSRSARLDGHGGWFSIAPLDDEDALELQMHFAPEAAVHAQTLVERVRRMFDLDRDPRRVASHLRRDPLLRAVIKRYPGLRLPMAFDPFEQTVRAIVGQQITVKAAVTITGRLVERLGEPLPDARADGPQRLFPSAEAIAGANLDGIGMPGKRVATLQRFADACASGALALHAEDGADGLVKRLCALPGIGPWTAEYVAMRAFGEPDAFPAADLGLLKAPVWGEEGISARELAKRAEAWRPWRAYAAIYLWQTYANGG